MKKSVLLVAVVFALMAIPAMALPLTVSETLSFDFTISPNSQTLSFNQFNIAGYTLVSVKLDLMATEQANVTCENKDTIPADVQVSLTGFVTGTGPGSLSTLATLSELSPVVYLTAAVDPIGGGADYHDFGLMSNTGSDTDTIFSNFSAYKGLGTVDIVIFGQGGHAVTGTSDYALEVLNFKALGDATITYTYEQTTVPEPSTIILAGSCLAGMVGVIRYKLKK